MKLFTYKSDRTKMLDTYQWPMIDGKIYSDLRLELETFIDVVAENKV